MSMPNIYTDTIFAALKPELEKLCKNASRFGGLTLQADIHNGKVCRVRISVDTTYKIDSQVAR